jgi:hypothetical protein
MQLNILRDLRVWLRIVEIPPVSREEAKTSRIFRIQAHGRLSAHLSVITISRVARTMQAESDCINLVLLEAPDKLSDTVSLIDDRNDNAIITRLAIPKLNAELGNLPIKRELSPDLFCLDGLTRFHFSGHLMSAE